jgi:hypothetical protein
MRIDSSGSVGIGTTVMTNKLNVAGAIQSSSSLVAVEANTVALSQESGYSRLAAFGPNSSTGGILYLYSISSNGSVQNGVIINSSGNVGIGTASPSVRLEVAGSTISQDTLQVFNNPTTSAQGILFRNTFNVGASIFSTGAATSNGYIIWRNANGDVGSIAGNGSGINYNTTSDYRLKENVAQMTGALATVAALKPVTYKWKKSGLNGQGFIAHELAEVAPECVTGKKDAVDEEGNPVYQGVDTSFLVATLTAAIQELKAEFDEYKASHP